MLIHLKYGKGDQLGEYILKIHLIWKGEESEISYVFNTTQKLSAFCL